MASWGGWGDVMPGGRRLPHTPATQRPLIVRWSYNSPVRQRREGKAPRWAVGENAKRRPTPWAARLMKALPIRWWLWRLTSVRHQFHAGTLPLLGPAFKVEHVPETGSFQFLGPVMRRLAFRPGTVHHHRLVLGARLLL